MTMWKTCLLGAVAAVLALGAQVRADDVRIQGTGATFPAPLYAKWIEKYNADHPGVKIDYQAIGSGGGIKAITDKTVQFGASDAPMNAEQEKAAAGIVHLPTVGGPEVLIYNVPGLTNLKLNGEVIAGIYLKQIRNWNNEKIAALNPGVSLPDAPIVVVHRSDGSGTSYIFTDYLSKVSPEWKEKVGKGTSVQWPVGLGGNGNPGVTTTVKNTAGGIGYVEYAYAKTNNLTYATLINKNGKESSPTIENIVAATDATLKEGFPENMKVSITNAGGDASYPICGYTYLLIYDDLSYMKDKNLALQTVQFIAWCETDGQGMAADLNYAKLPKDAQDKVIAKLKTIKFDGETLLK